jgi:hypothetical protein
LVVSTLVQATVGVTPQSSVAVTLLDAHVGIAVGLHPKFNVGSGQSTNTGGVVSTVQLITCEQLEVNPHPPVAV